MSTTTATTGTAAATPARIFRVAEVNAAIADVSSKKAEWAALPVAEKLALLKQVQNILRTEYNSWARNGCVGLKYEFDNPQHGHLVSTLFLSNYE
jgi:acyl-CoA reductase-like NAD-dependent aldehyde dehydrogenase